ncbi:leucine-rich repeat domain-containing protein [Rickettsia amblyommatis]|uniref:Leucine Rich repeat family protein n=1 Tax=Rickettsia amblyommatis (strain GAT-30V) TaxID=1105111 RepID=H8K2F3_RICAG|nr:leucine-rich repeat domain-containing protein [Rickettsia amblyommatis]AFC69995.1 hypothetical protein MCE_05765 [Rickettsia amblyommatis str. GAT-30V]
MTLAWFLANNSTIKYIDLEGNNIGDFGIVQLVKALEINRTIKEIDFGYVDMSNDRTMELIKILESNKVVSEITIDFAERMISNEIGELLTKARDIHDKKLTGSLSVV